MESKDWFGGETITSITEPNQIAKEMNRLIKKNWHTSYNYDTVPLTEYMTKVMPDSILLNKQFIKSMTYVTKLIHCSRIHDYSFFPEGEFNLPIKELEEWNNKGGLCLYASVLLYTLLRHENVVSKNDLEFIQGFFLHEFLPGSLPRMLMQYLTSFHVFLSINGVVVDASIQTVYDEYDFMEEALIIGHLLQDTRMFGYKETEKTVKKYLYRIVKKSDMTEEEWIRHHVNLSWKCIDLMEERWKEIQK